MTMPADFFGIAYAQQASIARSFFQPAANDGFEPIGTNFLQLTKRFFARIPAET